ncbi:MAG: hypothetical protein L0I92_06670 [Staphylococcus equorum]|nr:hypothetical protein [Staphylococcus equorum]
MKNFTEIYNEYKPQIEKLDKQFKKLQKHTQDLSYTDLKLHEVAYYIGHNEREINAFQSFCDVEFEYFNDWLQESNLTIEQIGRTSSFYFYSDESPYNFYDFDIYDMKEDENIFDTLGYGSELETLFNSESMYQAFYDFENYSKYDLLDSEDLENLDIEFDNSIYELEEYLQAYYKQVKAVKRAYKWLENYKANQVENFKDFVANNEF